MVVESIKQSIKQSKKNNNIKKRKTEKRFKKMNCNPIVEGKTVNKFSCLTPEVLNKIKIAFNKHHPSEPILESDFNLLWMELKRRLNNCTKEDCWLKQIEDAQLREHIDNMTFAPDHPPEWKKVPNTWLSNVDIFEVLKQYQDKYKEFKMIGPTPIDFDTRIPDENGECVWEELCTFSLEKQLKQGITKIGVVFNLDKHNQGGSHWVSLFIDLADSFLFFFDSNGDKIPRRINKLVQRIVEQGSQLEKPIQFEFYENHPFEHQRQNTECGMYSLFFIISMLTHKVGSRKFKHFKDKIAFFKKKRIPDEHMLKYRKKLFNGGEE
jgi:Ulp1 protease family, C-terminal catalytic domain